MTAILPNGKNQFFGTDIQTEGPVFLDGGLLYTYQPGTTTPKPTYQDPAGTVENTNPIVLDSRGEALIYWKGAYDITLADSLNNIIYSVPGLAEQAAAFSTSSTGSAIIPAGSTDQRDDPALPGYFRYNVDNNLFEGYYDGEWKSFQELLISGTNLKTINGQSLLDMTSGNDLQLPVNMYIKVIDGTSPVDIEQADLAKYISFTSNTDFSQALNGPYEDGFWCIIKNNALGAVTVTAGIIDGMIGGYVMYPQESRRFIYSLADDAWNTILLSGFRKNCVTSDTFVPPPGYIGYNLDGSGGGGGGGGGQNAATTIARNGGAGGGGAIRLPKYIPAETMPNAQAVLTGASSVVIAVGAGGAAGVGGGTNTVGSAGGTGGNTSVIVTNPPNIAGSVTYYMGYGAGGGMGGNAGQNNGGGSGSGAGGPGVVGTQTGAAGGLPSTLGGTSTAASTSNIGFGGAGSSSTNSGNAEQGGAAGGGNAASAAGGWAGGSSINGGAGGGAGASVNSSNTSVTATAGGTTGKYTGGGGGVPGGSAAGGFPGQAGLLSGWGGGGGGAGTGLAGAAGGAGGPGGGGGGGGASTGTGNVGGAGGPGGDGWLTIRGVF